MRWLLAVLALMVAAVLGSAWWLLYTEPGLHWVAARAQSRAKVSVEGLGGALARDIVARSITYEQDKTRVVARDVSLRIELLAVLGSRAGIRELRAEEIAVTLGPPDGKPPTPPKIPLALRIDRADIEHIVVQRESAAYRLENVQLRDGFIRPTGGLSASLSFLLRYGEYPVQAALKLGGTLERTDVAFDGTVAEIPARVRAVVTAFRERPLESLEAEAGPVDLARLNPEWPVTALGITLWGKAGAAHALAGNLRARNSAPGPMDQRRIPLLSMESAFSTDFKSLVLDDLKVALSPAGTLVGKATVERGRAQLDVRVAELDLRAFRSTLNRTQLAGTLQLVAAEKQMVQGTLAQDGMRITASVVRDADVIDIRSLHAEAQGGSATGSGRVRLGEPVSFEAKLQLARFDPARFGRYPNAQLSGTLDASGVLGPSLRVDARWVIDKSLLEGEAFASRGAARISRGRTANVVAEATLANARLSARGDFGRPGDELGWALEAPSIEHFFGDVSGSLRANGRLTGTFENPQGSLAATASALRLPHGMGLRSVSAKASGSVASHVADVTVRADDVDLSARLRGGWKAQAGWSGEVQSLRNAGRYPLELRAPVALQVAPDRAQLGRLEASLGDGRLLVKALNWSGKRLSSSGEFSGLPAQWLILAAGLTERLRSSLLVDGHWNLSADPRLNGTVSMKRATGDLTITDDNELALELEKLVLDLRFTDGRLNAQADLGSRFATVNVKGELRPERDAPGLGITAQSALSFEARVAFAALRSLTQPLLTDARLDGRLSAELRGSGTLAKPLLAGTLRGDALTFDLPPLGVFLRNGQLRAVLEGESLRLTEFSIEAGEGKLTATGTLPLNFAQGGAKVIWQAERFGLMERPDMRLVATGSGEAQIGADKRVSLSGALRADRGYLELEQERLPKLGEDVVVIGQERPNPKRATRVPLALDLQLDLGEQLEVRGYGLEGKLAGQLQIETTKDGELRAYGRIRTVNATFLAYGNRLQVDPGVAIFDGPLDNPSLQMTAWRRNQQVEVGVQVTGNARSPRVQLVSQPPVPEGERLSWLVLGRAPADATKADLGLLQAAAGALLSRGDQMPLDRRIARAFGLDEISFRGSGEVADRVVAVGKRLSDRLYISYEQGLGAAASALVKLDFSLTQRLAVRAETGTSSGIGLFYRFSWD